MPEGFSFFFSPSLLQVERVGTVIFLWNLKQKVRGWRREPLKADGAFFLARTLSRAKVQSLPWYATVQPCTQPGCCPVSRICCRYCCGFVSLPSFFVSSFHELFFFAPLTYSPTDSLLPSLEMGLPLRCQHMETNSSNLELPLQSNRRGYRYNANWGTCCNYSKTTTTSWSCGTEWWSCDISRADHSRCFYENTSNLLVTLVRFQFPKWDSGWCHKLYFFLSTLWLIWGRESAST